MISAFRRYLGDIKLQRDLRRRWEQGGRRPAIADDPIKSENFMHRTNPLPYPCARPGCRHQSIDGEFYCGTHRPRFRIIPPRRS